MTEQQSTSTQDGNQTGDSTSGTGDEFKAITSQEELNRIVGERVQRERARYSDYRDLKAKAAKFDDLEQANQSDLEKANNRVGTAETERDDARAESLRLRTAIAHGISLEDADLFLTGRDEETLTAQAKRLSDREADRKKQGNHVPREGNTSQPKTDNVREFTRGLFGGE